MIARDKMKGKIVRQFGIFTINGLIFFWGDSPKISWRGAGPKYGLCFETAATGMERCRRKFGVWKRLRCSVVWASFPGKDPAGLAPAVDGGHKNRGLSNRSPKWKITPAGMNSGRGEIVKIGLVRQPRERFIGGGFDIRYHRRPLETAVLKLRRSRKSDPDNATSAADNSGRSRKCGRKFPIYRKYIIAG